jgi:preprotein translocase subunit SecE
MAGRPRPSAKQTDYPEQAETVGALVQELLRTGIYKRSQGRITRQVTFAVIAITVALGLWRLSETLVGQGVAIQYAVPGLLLAGGLWAAYRLVNVPAFADFLIAVEAEMNKVSWPTRSELIRASLVVLVTIFLLAALLFMFDYFWITLFRNLGVR